jgi:hypothetical protein
MREEGDKEGAETHQVVEQTRPVEQTRLSQLAQG